MKTAAVTGGIGDIVYAIPIMRLLDIGLVYVKEDFYPDGSSKYSAMKRFLMSQGIESLPTTGGLPISVFDPKLVFDIDLDAWRIRPGRNRVHIIRNMMIHYGLSYALPNWNKPFIRNFQTTEGGYDLIFLSPRWREGSTVDWLKVMSNFKGLATYFIGLKEDHDSFCKMYTPIPYSYTKDIMDMATVIANCSTLYTNQSVALTLAQGLGKTYWLERKPTKTNTLFYTPNEHLL